MAVRPVGLGQHVRGAPLVDVNVSGGLGDLRDELDGARPRAHNGYPLAGEIETVVPAARVPRRTGEIGMARDVRNGRTAELAYGGDNGACLKRVAVIEFQLPHRPALIELGRGDARPEAQARAEPARRAPRAQGGQELFPGGGRAAHERATERE